MTNEQGGASANRSSIWTISNVITIVRILLVPVFVAALLAPWPEWFGLHEGFGNNWKSIVAAVIFVLISCTDWLDGYLARSRNEVTDFGKFMDPLADKILVAAALIALVELGSLPTWVVLVILAREFIVSGVRMMAASKGVVIAASMLGKFKTVFQMIAIVLFVIKDSHMIGSFGDALADQLWVVSWAVMLIAVGLTIASMIDYLVKAKELLGFGEAAQRAAAPDEVAHTAPAETPRKSLLKERMELRAAALVEKAIAENVTLATAESLTGGMIGSALTSVAGSSAAYRGGVVSYVNEVKHDLLGVPESVLESEGAVCEKTACQMAAAAREALKADAAVAVTGIAGPTGAEEGKPVGTVWIAVSTAQESAEGDFSTVAARRFEFSGDRDEVRIKTALQALDMLEGAI